MSEPHVPNRQHAVKPEGGDPPSGPVRPPRTEAGDAFTALVVQVASLGGRFTEIGEGLATLGGTTLARWVVLDAVAAEPATVAQVARALGQARQSVQRVADLLVSDGLAVYRDNPAHQRAKLLGLTEAGADALRVISTRQKAWADAVGAELGLDDLAAVRALLDRVGRVVAAHEP